MMSVDDFTHRGQSQTAAGGFGRKESLKQLRARRLVHAGAIVDDRQLDAAVPKRVCSSNRPPAGIASWALRARFKSICRIRERSTRTGGKSEARCGLISILCSRAPGL